MVGVKDLTGRYRMSNPHSMPKFEAAKNPFRCSARPTPMAEPSPSGLVTVANFAEPAQSTTIGLTGDGIKAQAAETLPKPQSRFTWPDFKKLFSAWKPMLRPVKSLMPVQKIKVAKPTAAKTPPVQGELSLEGVKVMRNDLSDSDLEIVSSPSTAKRNTATALRPNPELNMQSREAAIRKPVNAGML